VDENLSLITEEKRVTSPGGAQNICNGENREGMKLARRGKENGMKKRGNGKIGKTSNEIRKQMKIFKAKVST
jgi:hypothetical protein